MKKIKLKNGHLYKDGVKMELEFGNMEQIDALRTFEKKIAQLTKGVNPDCEYEVKAKAFFECVCGEDISCKADAEDVDDIDCFDELKSKCYSCNREYEFVIDRKYYADPTLSGKMRISSETLNVKLKQ